MQEMKDGKPTGVTTPNVDTVYVDVANKTVSITNLLGNVLVNAINKTTDEIIEFSGDDGKAFMTGGSLNRFTGEHFLTWHNREMWMSQFQQGGKPIPFDAQVLSHIFASRRRNCSNSLGSFQINDALPIWRTTLQVVTLWLPVKFVEKRHFGIG
jgi:hypothetical protein